MTEKELYRITDIIFDKLLDDNTDNIISTCQERGISIDDTKAVFVAVEYAAKIAIRGTFRILWDGKLEDEVPGLRLIKTKN